MARASYSNVRGIQIMSWWKWLESRNLRNRLQTSLSLSDALLAHAELSFFSSEFSRRKLEISSELVYLWSGWEWFNGGVYVISVEVDIDRLSAADTRVLPSWTTMELRRVEKVVRITRRFLSLLRWRDAFLTDACKLTSEWRFITLENNVIV